jgi:hypothetical protein
MSTSWHNTGGFCSVDALRQIASYSLIPFFGVNFTVPI